VAAIHCFRRGPTHANAIRAELQLQRSADHCRGHGAASWLCSDRKARSCSACENINQATAGPVESLQQRRPFNGVYPQLPYLSIGSFREFQLQFPADCPAPALLEWLTLYASHAWSHSIDDASNGICSCTAGVSLPQTVRYARRKAVSSFDQRQRFTLNFVYDLDVLPRALNTWPKRLTGGWQVSGIYTLAGGVPINSLLNGAAPSGNGESSKRSPECGGQPRTMDPSVGTRGLTRRLSWPLRRGRLQCRAQHCD